MENGIAIFSFLKKKSYIYITESVVEFLITCEQAEHCLMALDKAQVKMTLEGKSFMETETIVLEI